MTTPEVARQIMGKNFIGHQECKPLYDAMGACMTFPDPDIPYTQEHLKNYKDTHILILILSLSIGELRYHFGVDPEQKEPCFYNQDWYLQENFITNTTESNRWCLLPKQVESQSRSKQPTELIETYCFPTAQQCTFAFFAYYFASGGEKLWEYDFVWCRDLDHNGDRIYVGKYSDIDGVNRSGFSIHRHLALRPCYGAINVL